MTLCCSLCDSSRWSFCSFCVLLLCGGDLWGQSPSTIDGDLKTLWSEELPRLETRVSWALPSIFPSSRWGIRRQDASIPLQPPPEPRSRLFGTIDRLGNPFQNRSKTAFADPFVHRADKPQSGSSWWDWQPAPEEESIVFVRGGPPPLLPRRGRIRAEYGDEFDEVKRIRGQIVWALSNHVGIDASVNSWEDNRPAPKGLGDFWTGDANIVYSMGAQRIAMRGGVGTSWVYDTDYEFGYNVTYGADVFLTRPWLLSGEIDYGTINDEKLFHWKASIGVQLLLFEVYLGYDSYEWNQIRFDGPVVGAGLWF